MYRCLFSERATFSFLFFLLAPPCVKSVTSLRAGAKPDMPLLPR